MGKVFRTLLPTWSWPGGSGNREDADVLGMWPAGTEIGVDSGAGAARGRFLGTGGGALLLCLYCAMCLGTTWNNKLMMCDYKFHSL